MANIHAELNREFNRPKSEAQSIVGFKEITMQPGETPWELDQRLKCTIREANMNLTDGQHCEWFVALLLPLKGCVVTTKDNNSGGGLGDCDEIS